MKVTVGIPSRGRPFDLSAAVLTLEKTKSQGHEVEYIVGVDTDDTITNSVVCDLAKMGIYIRPSIALRGMGLGEVHNRLVSETDPDSVFLLWSDRVVPITEAWDHAIVMGVMQFPLRVLWLDSIHLIGAGQFILPPKWRAALPGAPCPGYFPFWFEDTWVEEVDAYVHGHPRVATYAKCAGPRTAKTTRMRDLEFWIGFFTWCRKMRLEEAKHITEKLGVFPRDNREMVKFYEARDVEFLSRKDILTETWGAVGEPDVSYLKAKHQAEAMMADRNPAREFISNMANPYSDQGNAA